MKRPFETTELYEFSGEHLAYEIRTYHELVRAFAGMIRFQNMPRFVNNALVESHAIHLRNLIDFLYPTNPHITDVIAADFLPEKPWNAIIGDLPKELEKMRVRSNKEVAHLSTLRRKTGNPEKQWPVAHGVAFLAEKLAIFIAQASRERLHPKVSHEVQSLKETADRLAEAKSRNQ